MPRRVLATIVPLSSSIFTEPCFPSPPPLFPFPISVPRYSLNKCARHCSRIPYIYLLLANATVAFVEAMCGFFFSLKMYIRRCGIKSHFVPCGFCCYKFLQRQLVTSGAEIFARTLLIRGGSVILIDFALRQLFFGTQTPNSIVKTLLRDVRESRFFFFFLYRYM